MDAEWSLNVGNWLWLSGSTFVKEHVPWYCPVEVGRNVDPTGEYIRFVILIPLLFNSSVSLLVKRAGRCLICTPKSVNYKQVMGN